MRVRVTGGPPRWLGKSGEQLPLAEPEKALAQRRRRGAAKNDTERNKFKITIKLKAILRNDLQIHHLQ